MLGTLGGAPPQRPRNRSQTHPQYVRSRATAPGAARRFSWEGADKAQSRQRTAALQRSAAAHRCVRAGVQRRVRLPAAASALGQPCTRQQADGLNLLLCLGLCAPQEAADRLQVKPQVLRCILNPDRELTVQLVRAVIARSAEP